MAIVVQLVAHTISVAKITKIEVSRLMFGDKAKGQNIKNRDYLKHKI